MECFIDHGLKFILIIGGGECEEEEEKIPAMWVGCESSTWVWAWV